MKKDTLVPVIKCLLILTAVMLTGCRGILSGLYDEPEKLSVGFENNRIFVDASNWEEWHYIDLISQTIETISIPTDPSSKSGYKTGIYTYQYDIFGEGIGKYELLGFGATENQKEPEEWTFALHRNNVRTNDCGVCETYYTSIDQLPSDSSWLDNLEFEEDEWNQTDVWVVQDKMLSGIIGNQGIKVSRVLSGWLNIIIPPMPPSFSHNNHVFIIKLKDGSYAALQLAGYIGASGSKFCLDINYKYPL